MKMGFALVAALGAAGLVACSTTANVEGQFNARESEASGLRQIALLGFTGPNGDEFGRALQAQLASATSNGGPWFTIASGEVVKARSGASGSDAQAVANAVAFGKQNRVEAVYFGRTDSSVESTAYQEQRTKCLDDKCKSKSTYNVNCTKVTAAFTAFPQIVNVSTAALAYAKTISKSATESYCEDRVRSGTDGALLGSAMVAVSKEIRLDVAPYTRTLQVEVKGAPDKISKAQKEQFDGAVKFVSSGRMDRACGIWEALSSELENEVALIYNLGVCAEASGDFKRALEYYTKADGKLAQPDPMINRALVRAKALSEGREAPAQPAPLSLNSLLNPSAQ